MLTLKFQALAANDLLLVYGGQRVPHTRQRENKMLRCPKIKTKQIPHALSVCRVFIGLTTKMTEMYTETHTSAPSQAKTRIHLPKHILHSESVSGTEITQSGVPQSNCVSLGNSDPHSPENSPDHLRQ